MTVHFAYPNRHQHGQGGQDGQHGHVHLKRRGRGMPTLLMKTSRVFLASARKSRPVFLPLKTAPPIGRRRGFSRQSEGRHNITHYTLPPAKCVAGARPCTPSGCASREMGRLRFPFPPRLAA